MFARDWGEANTCFQVLFLNSICVIKVELSIIYMGKKNTDKICHPILKNLVHGSFARFLAVSGLVKRAMKSSVGIKAEPITLSQKEAVRFVLSNSDCVDIIKLISYC